MDEIVIAKALSSGTRLEILRWLRDPEGSFESRVESDLTDDGV
jgi:DNA-binding transcriptional ArsR family regulator